MSRTAWLYVLSVIIAGSIAVAAVMPTPVPETSLISFVALAALTTAAQLFKVVAGRQTYYATLVFIAIALVVLPANLLALTIIIAYLVEWIKERWTHSNELRYWYMQPFNIASNLLPALAARQVALAAEAAQSGTVGHSLLLPLLLAAFTYVAINHLLVGFVLWSARGLPLLKSGVLETWNLAGDLILLSMGFVLSEVWTADPLLVLAALGPLPLLYRALQVPELQKDASIDPKTGLWNAKYFMQAYKTELARTARLGHSLSFLMADLDLLRNVNNTYGHLAGDAVLIAIGKIIRETVRQYDMSGRFGGEEFAVALPETGEGEARAMAERIRETVEQTPIAIPNYDEPIHVTISIGVSIFPKDAGETNALIHEADVAVYQAKLLGRNRVVLAADVPHSERLRDMQTAERATTGFPFKSEREPTVPPAHADRSAGAAGDSPAATTPQASPSAPPAPKRSRQQAGLLPWYVAIVIAAGTSVSVVGLTLDSVHSVAAIGLLALLAFVAEAFHIDLYGDSAISVTMAFNFAAALIGGLPSAVVVSGAIALGDRAALLRQGRFSLRESLYKAPFNWAVHVLGALAPLVALSVLTRLELDGNLVALVIGATLAAACYFLIETGLVAGVIGLSSNTAIVTAWRERHRWLMPHYLVMGTVGLLLFLAWGWYGALSFIALLLPLLLLRYAQKQYVDRTSASMRELRRLNAELRHANQEVVGASHAMRELNDELFFTLSKIIDARDPYVSGHAGKVADYAQRIGTELGFAPERLERLRQAAFLHDIGKIAIPEAILQKPAVLTPEEYEVAKTHAAVGASLLQTSRGLRQLAPFVRHHHERWAGGGYPDGLRANQIPLEARILALCDAVEAMASDRPYHRGMSLAEIIAELRRCRGEHFDPEIVDVFIKLVDGTADHVVTNIGSQLLRQHDERFGSVLKATRLHPLMQG
jgi:diguanylate cyclase (GGDEF)-like protein